MAVLCAGHNGGISYNLSNPYDIYHSTSLINLNSLEACRVFGIKKTVLVLTSCSYADSDKSLLEEQYLEGFPNYSVSCHAWAKRGAWLAAQQLVKQYKMDIIGVVFNNLFGINDRWQHPERMKVVGSLIKKFVDAKHNKQGSVVLLSSCEAKREFLYADDAATGLIKALELYNDNEKVLNIGNGSEITIKKLAEVIKQLTGYQGVIEYDTSKPCGQMRKLLNNNRMLSHLHWYPKTLFIDALEKTIKHYEEITYGRN